jgi:hypothetical protein
MGDRGISREPASPGTRANIMAVFGYSSQRTNFQRNAQQKSQARHTHCLATCLSD